MKHTLETVSMMFLMIVLMFQFHMFNKMLIPIAMVNDNMMELKLINLGAPKNKVKPLAVAIRIASIQTDISSNLLIALMYTESSFDQQARSNKNYKGYMQIPHDVWYADANVLIGARILKEKLSVTGGDLIKALCLYKGWKTNDKRGLYEANKVIKLYQSMV